MLGRAKEAKESGVSEIHNIIDLNEEGPILKGGWRMRSTPPARWLVEGAATAPLQRNYILADRRKGCLLILAGKVPCSHYITHIRSAALCVTRHSSRVVVQVRALDSIMLDSIIQIRSTWGLE
jgi:hypothetical protein